MDNNEVKNKSYISVIQITDETKPIYKTVIDVNSSSSSNNLDSSQNSHKNLNNSSIIHVKYNSNHNSAESLCSKTSPGYRRINENRSEEVFWTRNDDLDVETRVIRDKNPDGSIDRTTITTTYYPNGQSKQEAYVETIFEDECTSSSTNSIDLNSDSKRNYQTIYKLTANQFDLMENFFKKLENNGYILKNDLRKHIILQARERKKVCRVSEKQIERAIDTIDASNDGYIDFNQFIQFMNLFFSSKFNIKRKIVSVLNGQSYSHFEPGYLQKHEAKEFANFLKKFYGYYGNVQVLDDDSKMNYETFAEFIYPYIEKYLFIKWSSKS